MVACVDDVFDGREPVGVDHDDRVRPEGFELFGTELMKSGVQRRVVAVVHLAPDGFGQNEGWNV